MHLEGWLLEIVVLIGAAALGAALFERLRLPSILGFLAAGVLLGPGVLGVFADADDVLVLAEFGVVFLLFEIGLELPVDRLRRSWRVVLASGGIQVAATLAITAVVARGFGLPWPTALVVGALMAMSSTAVVMRLLSERGELDAPHGQVAVGVLLFQDLCIVPFLLALPLLAAGTGLEPSTLLQAVAAALGALFLFTGVARFLLPFLLERVANLGSRDLFSLVAVLVVMGGALAAEGMGLTLAVGAFLAGMVLSASPYGAQLFAEVIPLRGLLLGIFFTAVGMLLDPAILIERTETVLLFLAAAIGLKAIVVGGAMLFLRQGVRVAVLAGLALAQTGEFSFVLARAAGDAGLLEDELAESFIAASVLSLAATPLLVRAAPWLVARLRSAPELQQPLHDTGEPPVLFVGYGLSGRTLSKVLSGLGIPWRAVEANAASVREARARGEDVHFGDATRSDVLVHLGAANARAVVVAISDSLATRLVVDLVRGINPRARIFARTRWVLEVDRLAASGASHVVADEMEGTLDLLAHVLRAEGIPAGSVDRFLEELREEGYGFAQAPPEVGIDPWLLELLEGVTTEWIEVGEAALGQTLVELSLRAQTGAAILAVDRGGETAANPDPSLALQLGDRLLVFGPRAAVASARRVLDAAGEAGPS